jgi:hypothetical protein
MRNVCRLGDYEQANELQMGVMILGAMDGDYCWHTYTSTYAYGRSSFSFFPLDL